VTKYARPLPRHNRQRHTCVAVQMLRPLRLRPHTLGPVMSSFMILLHQNKKGKEQGEANQRLLQLRLHMMVKYVCFDVVVIA
jgi:hypothetical protein